MKKNLLSLTVLPAALLLALAFVGMSNLHADSTQPVAVAAASTTVSADVATVEGSDNQFLDGNWFTIASAKGEEYKTGSPTQVALQAQIDAYQAAVDAKDLVKEEHLAIRSWVKGWVAAEAGLEALQSGDLAAAKADLIRAKKYGKAAQKTGAGLGEPASRVGDDSAPAFNGTSKVEGARVVAYAKKYLAQVASKLGETGAQE